MKREPKFQIGDTVRCINNTTFYCRGDILTIDRIDQNDNIIFYYFKEKELLGLAEGNLELLSKDGFLILELLKIAKELNL